MAFIPNGSSQGCNAIVATTTSANLALPGGGGNEVLVMNTDQTNDACIEFGKDNSVKAVLPVDGGVSGSMLLPAKMAQPILLTLPAGATYWAAISRASTARVTVTRGSRTNL